EGSLFWLPGAATSVQSSLLWLDGHGGKTAAVLPVATRIQIALSPDGKQLASVSGDARTTDLFVESFERGTRARVSFDGQIGDPAWSPDGKWVAYVRPLDQNSVVSAAGSADVYRRAADGTGTEERLVSDPDVDGCPTYSHDGRFLVYERWSNNFRSESLW